MSQKGATLKQLTKNPDQCGEGLEKAENKCCKNSENGEISWSGGEAHEKPVEEMGIGLCVEN